MKFVQMSELRTATGDITMNYGIIAKTKVVIGASQPEARSAEGCDASRSPPLVEAMTPFHTTNARV